MNDASYPQKRHPRSAFLLLGLLGVLVATAILVDHISLDEEISASVASPILRAAPSLFARSSGDRGVTMPIGGPVLVTERGEPEDSGYWIDEDDGPRRWFLSSGPEPIDGSSRRPFALPNRPFGSFSSPVGGFRGFPGGLGGGSGGGTVIIEKSPAPDAMRDGEEEPNGQPGGVKPL